MQQPTADSLTMTTALVVDLDDTLVRTDTLAEQFIALVFRAPVAALLLLPVLLQGRAQFKARLAQLQPVDPTALPYHEPLLDFLRIQKATARPIHLVTAAHQSVADAVADHCGLFDSAEGSDSARNLKGARKAERLVERFPDGFAYAGDSQADLKVWARAESVVLTGATDHVARAARKLGKPLEAEFKRAKGGWRTWRRALRMHQWTKNLLVFLPLLLSHNFANPHAVLLSVAAFIAMGLTASATYLVNDLADLASDRRHATKRQRPLASGLLRIEHVAVAVPLLLAAAAALALFTSPILLIGLAGYAALTLTYTFSLKRRALLDVAALASLYAIRISIGAAVINTAQSPWLITFSLFFFFSMSLAKRYAEIHNLQGVGNAQALPGRGYRTDDGPAVLALGAASSVASVLIVVVYLMEEAFPSNIYEQPGWLWAAPFLLMIWVARLWLIAGRGNLDEDPIAFAIRDRFSWMLMIPLIGGFALATLAWP
jgi:4-hydroxybenzoate polyprenyltransferase